MNNKQLVTGFITTQRLLLGNNKKYMAILIGGRPIVDKNGKTIIRDTRKEVQDYINKNWKAIKFYN